MVRREMERGIIGGEKKEYWEEVMEKRAEVGWGMESLCVESCRRENKIGFESK